MATKNDITGDSIQSKVGNDNKTFADGWEAIWGNKKKDEKNFKHKQQDMTELNSDGNRDRGRNGEDES
jgi:hypothetical protein